MKQIFFSVLIVCSRISVSYAQHEHHMPAKDNKAPKMQTHDTVIHKHQMPDTSMRHKDHTMMNMPHAFSRNLPMTRNGSGTSWLPDNSPMYAYMFHASGWMYMLHGEIFLRYNKQDLLDKGTRGDSKFDAPNMLMFMGQKDIGTRGLFHFNTMFSLDPLTVGGEGYPLLFQTGETYQGRPLVDRQHPHDLFGELSVSYAHALSKTSDVFLYLAYPGEPALGPAAYVHRPSAFFNPDAPLTHHWVDATHITFGVATLGYRIGNFKVEASSFTGREPDENRYNFDKPTFDSWSGRLSFNPGPHWALQVSHGFIKSPESLHPYEDVNRTTASASFSARSATGSFTNVTALWGINKVKDHNAENGLLLEATHSRKKTTVYGRYEWVQKSTEELDLDEDIFGQDALFPVNAFTLGASYDVLTIGKTKLALGAQFSVHHPASKLSGIYGSNPLAGELYLRIYPAAMGRM